MNRGIRKFERRNVQLDLKRKYKLILFAGARPNFMKIAHPRITIHNSQFYEISEILKGNGKKGRLPELWDGKAAERMVEILGKL